MQPKKQMFYRCLAMLLVLTLSIALAPAPENQAKSNKSTVSMKAQKVVKYKNSPDSKEDLVVYFNGNGDIPYLDLTTAQNEVVECLKEVNPTDFSFSAKAKGNTVTWTRTSKPGSFRVVFDFKKNTIYFDDINGFFRQEGLSLVGTEAGMRNYMNLFQAGYSNYNRHGRSITIKLNPYGVKLLKDKKGYYIPLQTFSDIFYSRMGGMMLFNGKAAFITGSMSPELQQIYNDVPKKKMSKSFAAFNYGELCLGLDFVYGLKDTHGITSFDEFFSDTGFKTLLLSQDSNTVDLALNTFISLYFDDMHSALLLASYNTDFQKLQEDAKSIAKIGTYSRRILGTQAEQLAAREKYYPNGLIPYQEVGNTAYITFDGFGVDPTQDHTVIPTDAEMPKLANDTLRLMQYSLAKVTRAGSPIKRVVLDLSTNGGGSVYAADYLLAAFLGTSLMALRDVKTGAYSVADYSADLNLDGKFDEKDTFAGRGLDLYCFISGFSYSCANMVPALFKDTGKVTLVGRTSGGGTCAVSYLGLASGSGIQISGPMHFSFSKNGEFYDVDRGAEPDVFVKDMSKLYDREYMNTVLDGVK